MSGEGRVAKSRTECPPNASFRKDAKAFFCSIFYEKDSDEQLWDLSYYSVSIFFRYLPPISCCDLDDADATVLLATVNVCFGQEGLCGVGVGERERVSSNIHSKTKTFPSHSVLPMQFKSYSFQGQTGCVD